MRKLALILCACCLLLPFCGLSQQRIPITSIVPSENTGQDYSSWLSDNTDSLVADAWQQNMKYVDVTLQLQSRTLISKLTFFDGQGVFITNPALVYAVKGNERIYLGKFEGLTYLTNVDLNLPFPILADAILIHKYSNNIPQKIKVYGAPYDSLTMSEPQERLHFTSATPSENTGQNYDLWLNDNLDSTIGWGNANSFKYIDVTLKLGQRSKIKKLSFWDTEGVFSTDPAYIYAMKDTQKTYLGMFEGLTYNTWVDLILPEAITADSILIHKYSRYIPQKIFAYGQPLLHDPLDTVVGADGRLRFTGVIPAEPLGQDYSSWLNDDLDSLVPDLWNSANWHYTDVTLPLEGLSKVAKLSLYDYTGTFTQHPAYIYAKHDTTLTLIKTFTGETYMTFVDTVFQDSILADAIVVRKYGNDIPQKIRVFGHSYTPPVVPPAPLVKIPIDPKRWYQLNNVTDGIDKMFDGDTLSTIYAGYGKIITNYDAYYPVKRDEHIDIASVKFYDGQGALGSYPVTLSIINSAGQKIEIATFNGNRYNTWVGPYPDRNYSTGQDQYKLDSMMTDVRYLVLNCWYQYPNEIQFFGHYEAPVPDSSVAVNKSIAFRAATGINAFEWNFESPYDPYHVDTASFSAIKTFGGVRHYLDWQKLESTEGSYTYSPSFSGGWNYDALYDSCKAAGIEVLACIKTLPDWLLDTYPANERDAENVPVAYGADFSNPNSYLKQAKMGFQYIARYGANANVNPALLSVNSTPRWTGDETNAVRVGLNVIKYIECDNERDKWWKGRKAYQTAYEYAANLSAFYDGHKGTMGPGVGVKNADSTVKVVMGGLAAPDPGYVRGMIEWCRLNRGYKQDGSVNLCWDIINYHLYSNDANTSQNGNATRGTAPEKSNAAEVARAFRKLAHEEANDMPVWITELGYDINQGSPLKAIAIGSKSVLQTQADWNLRSALLYNREGIEKTFFYQLYDDNAANPTQFGSMGFLNDNRTRRPAADFMLQANNLIGNYVYESTLNEDPIVDKYALDGAEAYVITIPDETGRTANYTLNLDGVDSVKICTPRQGYTTMQTQMVATVNGAVVIPASETPTFVLVRNSTANKPSGDVLPISSTAGEQLAVYPNPANNMINVVMAASADYPTTINLIAAASGQLCATQTSPKGSALVSKQFNLANVPVGLYLIKVIQGERTYNRKVLKRN